MENNNVEPIILDQIANYNYQELEKNIASYKKYLNNQLALNRTLKNKNTSEIKLSMENFIDSRSSIIDEQYNELSLLKNELMKITNENTHLERENEELDLFMKTPQMKELANKLGEIENIQIEIIDFLEKNGVIKIHQV
ncbi:hypothetical protein N9O88_00055 [bacterium]|nr:hypothetical protein [bacterium]